MAQQQTPDQQRPSIAREVLNGARDQLPILLGVAPFGLIFGALALSAGIPPLEAQAFSLLVFAGSAQFIAVNLIAQGTPAMIVVLSILVVNLRHMLYSASMSPYLTHLSRRWKAVLAWLLTDEAYAVTSVRYRRGASPHTHWYFLSTGLTLWGTWQISTALGITLGAQIPEGQLLDFALPLTFIALIFPSLTDRGTRIAAITAGVSAVALAGLPFKLGLLFAALMGITLGIVAEARISGVADKNQGGP